MVNARLDRLDLNRNNSRRTKMPTTPQFQLTMAASDADVAAAQALRYKVFVAELGGDGDGVNHAAQREIDRFDAFADHLLLRDLNRPAGRQVIGVYRIMSSRQAQAAGSFSSAQEYDLAPLLASGRAILELSRSCLHPAYRSGGAMHVLWQGLADHIRKTDTQILFGVASFHGTDTAAVAAALGHLHHRYLAPPPLRARARDSGYLAMDRLSEADIDHKAAVLGLPALIKAYLRLGGKVGDGAYIDRAFNTIDVCMTVDVAQIPARQRARYEDPHK